MSAARNKELILHSWATASATLYNIAERLVSKSNADGYLVGSARFSVGSSLCGASGAASSEVNALPPHYRCTALPQGYSFDVDKSQYKVGVDLPAEDVPAAAVEELVTATASTSRSRCSSGSRATRCRIST